MTRRPPAYQCQNTVMLRASTAPSGLDLPADLFEKSDPNSIMGWIAGL